MPPIHAGMTKVSIFIFCRRAKVHETLRGSFTIRPMWKSILTPRLPVLNLLLTLRQRQGYVTFLG
jgi:hypothetical protein